MSIDSVKVFNENAKWIIDKAFAGLKPVNFLQKANVPLAEDGHGEDLKNRHVLVRKKFICAEKPQKACINITADDYYKLYINGTYVGQGPAPAYHFKYNVNQYDISDFLKEGQNIIVMGRSCP
jgi:hypothetical protein